MDLSDSDLSNTPPENIHSILSPELNQRGINIQNCTNCTINILICLSYLMTPASAANKYYDGESRPYEFGFKIENNQHRHEKRDENGLIMGEFGFVTADGIYHATVYATDEKGSFQIVSMQNLKIEEIVDLFNIPPAVPTPKFEIVPLKAATPPRYNSVEITSKLNAPLLSSKPAVDKKTCSNCKVPTTKRPIPITLAPVQQNTQKPFGIGLPEKLTTYRHYDVTPKQIVPSINRVDIPVRSQPGNEDNYSQVRAPEDQTQPIRKLSIIPTQSTFVSRPVQNPQPELRQNFPQVSGQLISTVKDSIQKVSLQQTNIAPQSPEMAQVIQKEGATKPSLRGPIHKQSQSLQNVPTASPGQELSQTIQPPLLDNGPVEQPQVHIKPSTESKLIGLIREVNQVSIQSQTQSNKPDQIVSPVQGQPPQNIPIEQLEVYPDPSPPRLSQPKVIPDRGSKQFSLPKIPENTPVETRPTAPITESVQKLQPQTQPIQSKFGDPVASVNGNLKSSQPQSPSHTENNNPTVPKIPSRGSIQFQSNGSPSPVKESLPLSQPPLPQNGVQQSVEYREPPRPTLAQSQNPPDREREYVQNLQPHISQNRPAEQPEQNVQTQSPQNAPIEQPSAFNRPSGPIQTKFISPVGPVNANLPDRRSQLPQKAVTDQPTVRDSVPLEIPAKQVSVFHGTSSKTQNLRGPDTSTPQPHNVVGSSTVSNIPSRLAQVQSNGTPSPIRESLSLSQPPLPQNDTNQSVEYREPQKLTLNQSPNPADREREYVQNLLPHISPNIPTEQPGVPVQIQFERPAIEISGSLQNVQPQSPQNAPIEQPSAFNRPSGPIQTKFINPVSSVNADLPDPQSHLPPLAITDQPTVRKSVPLETAAEQAFNGPSVKTQDLRGPGISTPQPHNEVGSSIVSNIPSRLTQIQSDGSPSPIRESLPLSQPPLLPQNGADKSVEYREPQKPTLNQSQNPPLFIPDLQSQLPPKAVTHQPTVRESVPLEAPAEKAFNGPSIETQTLRGPDTLIPQSHNAVGSSAISNIPSRLEQVNSEDSPNAIRESLSISQPPLPQNGLVDEELSKPTLTLSPNSLDRGRDSVQNIKPQVIQNVLGERPAINTITTTPLQDQSIESVRPMQDPVQNTQPHHAPVPQLPVLGNQIVPNKYETNNPANINHKSASPIDNKNDETLPDIYSPVKTGVLVIEPLSPAPEIRINLPKQLLNSVPRQIDSINSKQPLPPPLQTGKLLNELKEIMLNHKIKQTQLGGSVPLGRIGKFDKEFNVAQPLGSILYRFNYTAGYHGHHEQGDQGGNKEGGYYLISRDGYRRTIDYTANEDGYRPRIHIEYAQPQDVPQPETEKEKGLGGYEFKWFYV